MNHSTLPFKIWHIEQRQGWWWSKSNFDFLCHQDGILRMFYLDTFRSTVTKKMRFGSRALAFLAAMLLYPLFSSLIHFAKKETFWKERIQGTMLLNQNLILSQNILANNFYFRKKNLIRNRFRYTFPTRIFRYVMNYLKCYFKVLLDLFTFFRKKKSIWSKWLLLKRK